MRISRIHYSGLLSLGLEVDLVGAAHHYIARVLRLSPDDTLHLFNDSAEEYLCRITAVDKRTVSMVCERQITALPESPLQLHLFLSISKGTVMDFALQKATELGVTSIHPVMTEHTMRHYASGSGKAAHWQGVVRSAAEQCGRAALPEVRAPVALPDLQLSSEAISLALVPGASLELSRRLQQLAAADCGNLSLLIGPEGGLSEKDLAVLTRLGFEPVRIGVRILRTETAVTAAVSLAQAMLGDLRA